MKPRNLTRVRWSRKLAYLVGLIATDGSLSKDGRHIDFTSRDIDLILSFKRLLGITNKISVKISGETGKPCNHIQFGSVVFYNWLLNIGLMPNKSCKLGKLKIPDEYFFDFLRGSLDGDGYIRVYNDSVYPNSIRLYTHFFSASPTHLDWLRNRISNLLGIKSHIMKGRKSYGALRFGKDASRILLKRIYYKDNLPCLQRKKLVAKNFI